MELLRVFLMFLIVIVHLLGPGGLLEGVAPFSLSYFALWWIEGLGCVSTNVFILISGYYMIQSRLTAKKVIRLWMQVFFYSAGICLILILLGKYPLTWESVRPYIFPLINGEYWFITCYMALFLLSPALNLLIEKLDRRGHFLLLVTVLFLFSVLPTICGRLNILGVGQGYTLSWMICLYLTGAYIRKYPVRNNGRVLPCLLVWVACAAVYPVSRFIIRFMIDRGAALPADIDWLCKRNSVLALTGSVGLFLAFLRMGKLPDRTGRLVCRLSPLVFGVYLFHIHPLLNYYIWEFLRPVQYLHTWRLWPMLLIDALLVLAAGFVVEALRQILFRPLERSAWFERVCNAVGRACRMESLYRRLEPEDRH